ncbi:MAG: BMP family ABC transporter substrate-binding protein [Eubacteriales bacterium]|nr:BMP family ABC transporter substrate-binding protein [Eubacteriales bacterium]
MSKTEYQKARRKAQKTYRMQLLKGEWPYLQALDDIVSFTDVAASTELGLCEISLDAVAGTRTSGRKQAFASDFMPLLEDDSEFAWKWINLYEAHMEEGIREPITAVEFMNRYYVVEGNKRVSVLKYVGAVSIHAYVTRIVPRRDDSRENRIYYEFLDFYRVSQANYLTFSQEGCYARLLSLLDRDLQTEWTADERMEFHSAYLHFLDVYEERGGKSLRLTAGDAFLVYLEIYGYEGLPDKSYQELRREIPAIWKDFEIYPEKRSIELVMAPEEPPSAPVSVPRLLSRAAPRLKIAFIYDRDPAVSSWAYGHELGRLYLADALRDRADVSRFTVQGGPEKQLQTIRQAAEEGNSLIFTTSPRLLNASVKAAVLLPDVKLLNCSLNSCFGHLRTYYGRMYEARFLSGLLAGILSPEPSVGYVADYPIYGSTANINAFALGVRTTRPDAKVYLEWSCVRDNPAEEYFRARRISCISGLDLLSPSKASQRHFGLYDTSGGQIRNLAMPVWNWGKFYERIVRSVLTGAWKRTEPASDFKSVNYFWGMSSGLIDLICSHHVPDTARRLVEAMGREISSGAFQPFGCRVVSQDGVLQSPAGEDMPAGQIGSMDWLLDNVVGGFPALDSLTDEALEIVRLQGVDGFREE